MNHEIQVKFSSHSPRGGNQFIVTVRKHRNAGLAQSKISSRCRELNALPWNQRFELSRLLPLLPQCDRDAAAPFIRCHISTDDERNECPSFPVGRQNVEVMPFRPRITIRCAVIRQVEVIDVVTELNKCRIRPSPVAIVIAPRSGFHVQRSPHRESAARYFSAPANGVFVSTSRSQIQSVSYTHLT